VIRRDTDAAEREWEHGLPDSAAVFDGGHAKDDHERIHQNPLIPAEVTGSEPQSKTEIETPCGCRECDERPGDEDGPRRVAHVSLTSLEVRGVSAVNCRFDGHVCHEFSLTCRFMGGLLWQKIRGRVPQAIGHGTKNESLTDVFEE
jgi:hypothetical protein